MLEGVCASLVHEIHEKHEREGGLRGQRITRIEANTEGVPFASIRAIRWQLQSPSCSRNQPGRFVVMPSTPGSSRRLAVARSFTVQVQSFRPAALNSSTNGRSIGKVPCKSRPSIPAAFAWLISESRGGECLRSTTQ